MRVLSHEEKILIPPGHAAVQGDCAKITLTMVGRVR